jgi:hypothetical protein
MNRTTLRRALLPFLAVGAALAVASPAVADPAPIGPNQYFTAFVNGQPGEVRLEVICDGTAGTAGVLATGHPVAGQTVEVRPAFVTQDDLIPPPISNFGFTGSAGKAVGVSFIGFSAPPQMLLREYEVPVEIPTNIVVPCFGIGDVTFAPVPTSRTAAPATVKVVFSSKF